MSNIFLETIRLENGKFNALPHHQARMDKTRSYHFWEASSSLSLADALSQTEIPTEGCYRTRIVYGEAIEQIEYIPYQKRIISCLKLVEAEIDYAFKYADRTHLNRLFEERGDCDDVLITQKGYLADTSIANIALLKNGIWWTPVTPLLKGTRRATLLEQNMINEAEIHHNRLAEFTHIRLFNALLAFGEIELTTQSIMNHSACAK